MNAVPLIERGFSILILGEKHWLDLDVASGRVTIDLQHHGMMGQPGEVERVGEGLWAGERITERRGSLSQAGFDVAEKALRARIAEAAREN